MSKTKSPRSKKYSPTRSKSKHISAVLNSAMHKFYVMGDMNHNPMSFHTSEINMLLKGVDLRVALQEMAKFLYAERRLWHFAVYHFFKVDGRTEVVPTLMQFPDTLLNEVADSAEEYIQSAKDAVIGSDEGLTAENYVFYGYYINYGEDLRMDLMEDEIVTVLLKINKDLTEVRDDIMTCTAEKVLRAIAGEKFSLANSDALQTSLVLETA